MEQGRPNSAFIHLGIGARKAIAAGLHKEIPSQEGEASENVEERRMTFWYFYFYETLVTFLSYDNNGCLTDTDVVGSAFTWGDQARYPCEMSLSRIQKTHFCWCCFIWPRRFVDRRTKFTDNATSRSCRCGRLPSLYPVICVGTTAL